MKLTKSKLIELIKEELSLLGALQPEENFIRKYGIVLSDDADVEKSASDAFRSGVEVQEADPEDLENVAEAKKKKKKKRKLTKIQIKKRDKLARKIMSDTKEEYGKERGKDIAYAIATNQVKGKRKRS